jgi:para-nitrobenzyl esterase
MQARLVGCLVACLVMASCGSGGPEPDQSTEKLDNTPQRMTTAGEVRGFVGESGALTWRGIPFAKPPMGELRWHPPMPVEDWEGVRQAASHGNICPQFRNATTQGLAEVEGSEDCLYLDVYAPSTGRDLPVMFWIHGGGNSFGHAGTYDGSRLATSQDVIVVTTQYRLGHLGWFSHPALLTGDPTHDSGNYGILDIIAALKWTRDNIAAFGGDPTNVTIFGESAGANDVMALVIAPPAAGLFHRAIVQSGGLRPYPIEHVRAYAEDGGHRFSAPELVNQLLVKDGLAADAASARKVQDTMDHDALTKYLYSKTPAELWAPFDNVGIGTIPTPEIFADGRVLPVSNVTELLAAPDSHNRVPIILGTNRDEIAVFLYANPRHIEMDDAGKRLRIKDEGAYLREVKYGSMDWKEEGVDRFAIALTQGGNPNVYAYRFDWDEAGVVDGFDLSTALGASHAVEMPFVFGDFRSGWVMEPIFDNSPNKEQLAEAMMSYWTQFARTGDPGRGRDGTLPQWRAWDTDGDTTLLLDTPADGGVRMTSITHTPASMKAELAADPGITSGRERCARYAQMFLDDPEFDAEEYAQFGPEGCKGLDPREMRGF